MKKIIVPIVLAAAIVGVGAASCAAGGTGSGSGHADDTVKPSHAAAAPHNKPSDVTGLNGTWTWKNGVTAHLSDFSRRVSHNYGSPASTPYVHFTVTLKNGSSKVIDLSTGNVQCTRGKAGKTSQSIFDDGLDGVASTHLRPGHTATYKWGCELHSNEQALQVEVNPTFLDDSAIFAGYIA